MNTLGSSLSGLVMNFSSKAFAACALMILLDQGATFFFTLGAQEQPRQKSTTWSRETGIRNEVIHVT